MIAHHEEILLALDIITIFAAAALVWVYRWSRRCVRACVNACKCHLDPPEEDQEQRQGGKDEHQ